MSERFRVTLVEGVPVKRFDIRGQELFDLVCRVIGLRESYYFGLFYECPNQQPSWLRMNKKVC